MNHKGNRILYMSMSLIVMSLGLLSRKFVDYFPDIINMFLGDSLWALMVYFLIRTILIKFSINRVALISILVCFSIEFSQLYHGLWIEAVRRTTLGGLILGYGFLWSDLIAYLLGIVVGIIIDKFIKKYTSRSSKI